MIWSVGKVSAGNVHIKLISEANPNIEDSDRRTPLHSAIVKGSRSYECVRLLLDNGADVNHRDRFGYSPLHIAALNEYSYCANLLLANGADITARYVSHVLTMNPVRRKSDRASPIYILAF